MYGLKFVSKQTSVTIVTIFGWAYRIEKPGNELLNRGARITCERIQRYVQERGKKLQWKKKQAKVSMVKEVRDREKQTHFGLERKTIHLFLHFKILLLLTETESALRSIHIRVEL